MPKPIPPHNPWEKHPRPLPRVVTVSCTLTAKEFSRLAEEANRFGVSLSELGRERAMGAIPLEDWGKSAAYALNHKGEDVARRKEEVLIRRKERRSLRIALERGLEPPKQTEAKRERRVAQLQIRLTAYESVKLRWTAYCLHMSLAAFLRKMVLGYLPGGEDDHSIPWDSPSRNNRTNMLRAVISVAEDGRIPVSTSLFYCKACAQRLLPSEKQ